MTLVRLHSRTLASAETGGVARRVSPL